MANEEFLEFTEVNAEDSLRLMALKSQYNLCVSRLALAIMRGRNDRHQGLLNELRFLKEQIEAFRPWNDRPITAMAKLIIWKNAQAKHKTFTITAHAKGLDEARQLAIGAIAGLVPQTLSEEEGEALLNWTYQKEPVTEQDLSGAVEGKVSIARINEQ
jgi:hypothetical protein